MSDWVATRKERRLGVFKLTMEKQAHGWVWSVNVCGSGGGELQVLGGAAKSSNDADLALQQAVTDLQLQLQYRGPSAECPMHTAPFCNRHGFIHGAESSELREGIEKLVKKGSDGSGALQKLLDDVDARDSLAYEESLLAARIK